MTRLALVLVAAFALSASPVLAKADTPALPQPISVAVAPPDDGIPQARPTIVVPAAESKAAPASAQPSPANKPSPPELDDGHSGIGLKIAPFGWRILLIGR